MSVACSLLGIEMERLSDRSKNRDISETRRLVIGLGVERWRQRCMDLAEVLGKNPGVVSYWVSEAGRRRQDDGDFARRFDELDEAMENATRPGGGRHTD